MKQSTCSNPTLTKGGLSDYILIRDTYSDGTLRRTGYGIAALDRESVTIFAAHDLSSNETEVAELVKTCNRLKLSPMHLQDVVEDFLT